MSDEELLILMRDIESQRVERKESVGDKDSIKRAICAFANDLNGNEKEGVIFVGLKDDGTCSDLPVTDQLLQTLADLRTQGNILPFPRLSVEKRTLDQCELAVISVYPSDDTPVRYSQHAYVRVGPTTRLASEAEIRALTEKRRANDRPFDIRPVRDAVISDLDVDWFAKVYLPAAVGEDELAANNRTSPEKLASLRFIDSAQSAVPTGMGVLVAGLQPTDHIPCAYVQYVRVDGTKFTDPIKDHKELRGKISDLLPKLDDLLKINISIALDLTSASRAVSTPDYPFDALQQIVRNAVLHRAYEGTNAPIRINWFEDRVEISNPGGPYGQVNAKNFGEAGAADYRNLHLAEVLKNLDFVQRFGFGLQIAKQKLSENNNPDMEIKLDATHTLITVRKRQ